MQIDPQRYTVGMRQAFVISWLCFFVAGVVATQAQAVSDCPLRLVFVDVGEGDAILVQPRGLATLIVDTGSPRGGSALVRQLNKRELREPSGVVLTHPHLDHIGGLFTLLSVYPRLKLYHAAQPLTASFAADDMYRWYREALQEASERSRILRRGDSLILGEVAIETLWPPAGALDDDWNKNSLVLRIRLGAFSALLMGDALISTEGELLRSEPNLRATVLKVGHHGSAFASSQQFVTAVAPKLSVVSVNADNIRGYPAHETLERLQKIGEVRRTDIDGDIEVCAWRSGEFQLKASRGE